MKKATNKPKLNGEWHKQNVMPENPTIDQRIAWHLEHAAHCGCREIPARLKEEIKKRHLKLPS
jgi:hypothetical protein